MSSKISSLLTVLLLATAGCRNLGNVAPNRDISFLKGEGAQVTVAGEVKVIVAREGTTISVTILRNNRIESTTSFAEGHVSRVLEVRDPESGGTIVLMDGDGDGIFEKKIKRAPAIE